MAQITVTPPPRSLTSSPANYALQLSYSRPRQPVVLPPFAWPDATGPIQHLLHHAKILLDLHRPQTAVQLMEPCAHKSAAKNHYLFQTYLHRAYHDVVKELDSHNQLGFFEPVLHQLGNDAEPTFRSARLSCYLGEMDTAARCLELLNVPETKRSYLSRHSTIELDSKIEYFSRCVRVAADRTTALLVQIVQVNNDCASSGAPQEADQPSASQDDDGLAKIFTQIRNMPLFGQIKRATQPMLAQAQQADKPIYDYWLQWLQREQQWLLSRPEFKRASPWLDPNASPAAAVSHAWLPQALELSLSQWPRTSSAEAG